MVKKRELSYEERITVKILRENGHSFLQIAKVVGCYYSTCIRMFNSFKKNWLNSSKTKNWEAKKIN